MNIEAIFTQKMNEQKTVFVISRDFQQRPPATAPIHAWSFEKYISNRRRVFFRFLTKQLRLNVATVGR